MRTTKLGLIAFLSLGALSYAQQETTDGKIGVNTDTPRATLDINPNKTGAELEKGTTNEGILIPQISKTRAVNITNKVEGTLVYITTDITSADSANFTGTGKGFYYWDGASKWVKIGVSSTSASTSSSFMQANFETKTLPLVVGDWSDTSFTYAVRGSGELALPAPKVGRIVALRNLDSTNKTITVNPPVNNTTLGGNRGMLIQSDGSNWYVIGGF